MAGTMDAASVPRREAILNAALECFTERGYAATSIDDIRRRADTSVGSVYHHFAGKEAIAAALYVEGIRAYHAGGLAVLAGADTAQAGVRGIVTYHLRWVVENRAHAQFLLLHGEPEVSALAAEPLQALNESYRRGVQSWLERVGRDGELRALPYDVYASLVIGPAQEFARRWVAGLADIEIDEAARMLAEGAWRATRADTDTPRPGRNRRRTT
jgi:AcrR family transcriptional regulator